MLVLTRRLGEAVLARMPDGRTLTVTVVEIRGTQVKLGFDAPRDVAVHREEIWNAIEREKADGR